MHYQISRAGQTYGPYTLDDLRRYLGTGNVLPTDLAKSDEMAEWMPVSQLLTAAPAYNAPAPGVSQQPAYSGQAFAIATGPALAGSPYPDAPNLPWGLVVLFSVLTCFVLFTFIWDIVIAAWLRRVQPSDKSLLWYLGAAGVLAFKWLVGFVLAAMFFSHQAGSSSFLTPRFFGLAALSKVATFAVIGLIVTGNFVKRASLLEHFNGPEPVGLELNGVMTFFFAPWYFQYHLNRINALKQAARYAVPHAS